MGVITMVFKDLHDFIYGGLYLRGGLINNSGIKKTICVIQRNNV
jgi:hypothetical protein